MNNQAVEIYRNAYILPHRSSNINTYGLGGVVDENRIYVQSSAFSICSHNPAIPDWGGDYDFDDYEEVKCNAPIIYGGFINNNEWGHFIADWSTRLWYALDNEYDILFCSREKAPFQVHRNIVKLIEIIGISFERIHIVMSEEPVQRFSEIIVPECSLTYNKQTKNFLAPFRRAVENISFTSVSQYSKVYLTRTQMKPCKEFGEEAIELLFCQMGYKVIAPETLSVEEQIELFASCEYLASLNGSAPHGVVFSKRLKEQIIIEKNAARNGRQEMINKLLGIRISYLRAHTHTFDTDDVSGPFLIGVTSDIKKFARRNGIVMEIPYWQWICNFFRVITYKIRGFFTHVKRYVLERI